MKVEISSLGHVGILLMGIGVLIASLVAAHLYFQVQTAFNQFNQEDDPSNQDFSVYCTKETIVISALKDLQDVSVSDSKGKAICSFGSIRSGSDGLCNVESNDIFMVSASESKTVIECYPD